MQDKEYEFRFGKVTKGLPDLERVVSRIHAGNCKIRDFLKVLEVRCPLSWSSMRYILPETHRLSRE